MDLNRDNCHLISISVELLCQVYDCDSTATTRASITFDRHEIPVISVEVPDDWRDPLGRDGPRCPRCRKQGRY